MHIRKFDCCSTLNCADFTSIWTVFKINFTIGVPKLLFSVIPLLYYIFHDICLRFVRMNFFFSNLITWDKFSLRKTDVPYLLVLSAYYIFNFITNRHGALHSSDSKFIQTRQKKCQYIQRSSVLESIALVKNSLWNSMKRYCLWRRRKNEKANSCAFHWLVHSNGVMHHTVRACVKTSATLWSSPALLPLHILPKCINEKSQHISFHYYVKILDCTNFFISYCPRTNFINI